MKLTFKIIFVFIVFLSIAYAGESKDKNQVIVVSKARIAEKWKANHLRTSEYDQLVFNYKIIPSKEFSNSYSILAEIKNNGSTPFYFLSESCNGLDSYIDPDPIQAQIDILIHCNVSMPVHNEIPPNSTFSFKSRLRTISSCESVRLKLMLIVLSEDDLVEGKSLTDFRLKSSTKTVQLIGPRITL